MNNIEKIVADYETCRKAWEIGLRAQCVFSVWHNTWGDVFDVSINKNIIGIKYPAPTAEEVPLWTDANNNTHCLWVNNLGIAYKHYSDIDFGIIDLKYHVSIFNNAMNEATARLKMAIWLIGNVPEAKKWYIDNGYLEADK